MGMFPRIHFRLSSSWDARLVAHAKFVPWINSKSSLITQCHYWRIIFVTHLGKAETLLEKIASNQGWSSCNIQLCNKSEEVLEEVCALSTKMDVLLNWLEQRANYKKDRQAIQDAFNAQNTCGEYLGLNSMNIKRMQTSSSTIQLHNNRDKGGINNNGRLTKVST